jgi:hypothetical protein
MPFKFCYFFMHRIWACMDIKERTEAGGVQGNVLRMDMELRR